MSLSYFKRSNTRPDCKCLREDDWTETLSPLFQGENWRKVIQLQMIKQRTHTYACAHAHTHLKLEKTRAWLAWGQVPPLTEADFSEPPHPRTTLITFMFIHGLAPVFFQYFPFFKHLGSYLLCFSLHIQLDFSKGVLEHHLVDPKDVPRRPPTKSH